MLHRPSGHPVTAGEQNGMPENMVSSQNQNLLDMKRARGLSTVDPKKLSIYLWGESHKPPLPASGALIGFLVQARPNGRLASESCPSSPTTPSSTSLADRSSPAHSSTPAV